MKWGKVRAALNARGVVRADDSCTFTDAGRLFKVEVNECYLKVLVSPAL